MERQSNIIVKTQGINGGNIRSETKGYAAIYASDNDTDMNNELIIDADSFQGIGKTYKRRKTTNINVRYHHKLVFNGNIDKFIKKLL